MKIYGHVMTDGEEKDFFLPFVKGFFLGLGNLGHSGGYAVLPHFDQNQ